QVVSQVASSFSITTEQANTLLTNLSLAPSTTSLLAELENENLIEKDSGGLYKEINRTNFPVHFNVYTLLHKSARIVSGMKIETENLEYFIAHGTELKTIDFSSLPVS